MWAGKEDRATHTSTRTPAYRGKWMKVDTVSPQVGGTVSPVFLGGGGTVSPVSGGGGTAQALDFEGPAQVHHFWTELCFMQVVSKVDNKLEPTNGWKQSHVNEQK